MQIEELKEDLKELSKDQLINLVYHLIKTQAKKESK
jgi:hypothetical protein